MFNDQELVGLVKAVARLSLALQQCEDQLQAVINRNAELEAAAVADSPPSDAPPTLAPVE